MKLFEYLIALSIALLLFSIPSIRTNHTLELAHSTLKSHIELLRLQALSDDTIFPTLASTYQLSTLYPSLDSRALLTNKILWQMQFHLGRIYTTHSYSLYIDTPRKSQSTNLDSRPMAGDIILKTLSRQCLSGYNNTNTSPECKNNILISVRLGERFGIDKMLIESDKFCAERESGRIYFDRYGIPYCAKIPKPLHSPFKITLVKNNAHKSLCILPRSGMVINC